jgi:DNA repair photolyase
MEKFNGDAIYNPSGNAGEYSYWACNFYVGCSNGCTYCYLRTGKFKKTMGGNKPTLKKCFKDIYHAYDVLEKELKANLPELQEHGLFFSFTTDPMLPETWLHTLYAMNVCHCLDVPVKVLTKCTGWVDRFINVRSKYPRYGRSHKLTAFGFTLTEHDELEPHASSNEERIEAMRRLHDAGFKTWVSLEPVIDFESSWRMALDTIGFCDLYKIGLESEKEYDKGALLDFMDAVRYLHSKIYFKDSLLKAAGVRREDLPKNCVARDYNIFHEEQ